MVQDCANSQLLSSHLPEFGVVNWFEKGGLGVLRSF